MNRTADNHSPTTDGWPKPRSPRGRWAVVFLLAAGVVLGVVAVAYKARGGRDSSDSLGGPQEPSGQPEGKGGSGDDGGDTQLQQLQEMLAQAQTDGTRITPILNAAQRLVERYPGNAGTHLFLAQLFLMQQQPQLGYEHLSKSLELDGDQAEVSLLAGTTALALGRPEQAEYHYAHAVGLDPANPRYRLHLAQVYIRQGNYDMARKDLLDVIRRDSSQHAAYASLADLYARQNKLPLAMTQIDKAIGQTPAAEREKRVEYLLVKAQLLRRDNQPDAALVLLGQLTAQEQFTPTVLEAMALSWAMTGQPARAAQLYEQALLRQPANATFAAAASRWRIKSGDLSAARDHLETLRRIDPRSPDITELERLLL